MKTKVSSRLRPLWALLTEVPGWPDAPLGARLRRALPILASLAATTLLLGWQLGYHQPRVRAHHAAHQHLLELEQEVADLQQRYSAQQVETLAAEAATLRQQLPKNRADVRSLIQGVDRDALHFGWIASVQPGSLAEEIAPADQHIALHPVRARLLPVETNHEPFPSLLGFLESLRAGSRRIDLMRLHISAEEGRWQTVELGLRFVLPATHAPAAE